MNQQPYNLAKAEEEFFLAYETIKAKPAQINKFVVGNAWKHLTESQPMYVRGVA